MRQRTSNIMRTTVRTRSNVRLRIVFKTRIVRKSEAGCERFAFVEQASTVYNNLCRNNQTEKGQPTVTESMADHELVVIADVPGRMVAEVLRAKLESAGIPAMLTFESSGSTLFPTPDLTLGLVQILVPKEFQEDALAVLEEEIEPDDEASPDTETDTTG